MKLVSLSVDNCIEFNRIQASGLGV